MIKITLPFNNSALDDITMNLRDKLSPGFSFNHKLYYNYIRPVLPVECRKFVNKISRAHIKLKANFIYDDVVQFIKENIDFEEECKTLYPNSSNCAIILTHDIDCEYGFKHIPDILEIDEEYGFKSSWNIVPYKYKIDRGIIDLINNAGHEIGIHGYNHDGRLFSSRKIFIERLPYINKAIEEYNSVGFRSPMVHREILWMQKLNIKYDSSCFDYDPFQPFPDNTGLIWPFLIGNFVELPYTIPQDYILFNVLKKKNIDIWINKTKWITENHGCIISLTHPAVIKDNNYNFYKHYLEYLKDIKNSWKCLPREMAEWWIQRNALFHWRGKVIHHPNKIL